MKKTIVSFDFSPTYGPPDKLAQAAYMLITQRGYKHGTPIPELLNVGSIADIARDLGLDDTDDAHTSVETALRQIAFAASKGQILIDTSHAKHIHRVSRQAYDSGRTAADIFYRIIMPGENLPDVCSAMESTMTFSPDRAAGPKQSEVRTARARTIPTEKEKQGSNPALNVSTPTAEGASLRSDRLR